MVARSHATRPASPLPVRTKSSYSSSVTRSLAASLVVVLCATAAIAQTSALDGMVRSEQRFAARALVVGWKQAFLEYFADDAIGFDGEQVAPAKELFRKQPDPPRHR